MLAFIFLLAMCFIAVKSLFFIFKLSWGIAKFAFGIFFLPIIIIMLFFFGLAIFAVPLLIVGMIVFLVVSFAKNA